MRNDDDGGTGIRRMTRGEGNTFCALLIHAGDGLVYQKNLGAQGQTGYEGHTLTFPAGKLMTAAIQENGRIEAHGKERGGDPVLKLEGVADAPDAQTVSHVRGYETREQVRRLKQEGNLTAQIQIVGPGGPALEKHGAAVRRLK